MPKKNTRAGSVKTANGKSVVTPLNMKARSHPTRVAILRRLADGAASPSEFASGLDDVTLPAAAYHFRALKDRKLIRPERTRPARGALEHFYVLTAEGRKALAALEALEAAA